MNPNEKQGILPSYNLFLEYDGKEYVVLRSKAPVYMLGEIVCELERATDDFSWLIKIIMGCKNSNAPASYENILQALTEIDDTIDYAFGAASGAVLMNVLASRTQMMLTCLELPDQYDVKSNFKVKESSVKKILGKGGFNSLGAENVAHALLSGLVLSVDMVSQFRELTRLVMDILTEADLENRDTAKIKHILYDNGDLIAAQQIDYRIMNIEEKLTSVYGIKDIMSVLMFELANCINNNVLIKKCNNCGYHFPIHGRPDVIYCSFKAPNGDGKTCKEIGAQVKRANKEKNDALTSEYRKIYLRKKMQVRRHPGEEKYQVMLSEFLDEGKKWQDAIGDGVKSEEEYLLWLKSI